MGSDFKLIKTGGGSIRIWMFQVSIEHHIYIYMFKNCSRVFHKTGKMIDTVLSIVVGYQGICRPALATW